MYLFFSHSLQGPINLPHPTPIPSEFLLWRYFASVRVFVVYQMEGKESVKCPDLPTKTPNHIEELDGESHYPLRFPSRLCVALISLKCAQMLKFTARVLDPEAALGD